MPRGTSTARVSTLASVDLPDPVRPITAYDRPGAKVRCTSRSAAGRSPDPYRKVRPRTTRSPPAGAAPPAGSWAEAASSWTRPQAPSAYCSSGTIRATCSTVAPNASASSQIAVSRLASMPPVARLQAPPATIAAMPARMAAEAIAVTRADIVQTTRPRASTRLARCAYSLSTYGRARLVRTSSWPWMDSSITAARSDQASSSPIRAGPIRRAGPASVTASSADSPSIASPAGHQITSAVNADSTPVVSDWRIRTPLLRSSDATCATSPSIRSSSSPTGVVSRIGSGCPSATRHSRRRRSADQSAVIPAASRPVARSPRTETTSAAASRANSVPERCSRTGPASAAAAAWPAPMSTTSTATSAVRRGAAASRSRSRPIAGLLGAAW